MLKFSGTAAERPGFEDSIAAARPPFSASVLFVIENAPVPTDRRVWREAVSLRRAGCKVSIISPRGQKSDTAGYELQDGIAIYRFPMPFEGNRSWNYLLEYGWALLATFWLSLRVWRARGLDVLHVGNPPDIFFPLAWFYKILGKRFIFDQHDLCPETYLSKFSKARRGPMWRLLMACEKLTYRAAHAVIVTNQSYRQVAMSRGGVPEDRVFIVRNSPNLALFESAVADPSLKGGFEYMVAFVGIMAAQDGVDYLLRAAHHVLHAMGRRDVLFVLVGTGPAWTDLQKLHGELKLGESVRFTGRIPDAPMLRLLATADVCASPDPFNPLNDVSTMTKLMEFMAMGKASVSFDLKEARFSAGESAVYVPDNDWRAFGEAIVALLENPERRAHMGEIGKQRIRGDLSWAHSEANLRAAYSCALGLPTAAATKAL